MTSRHFISRFTPSRTAPEDLEAIFVQRRDLLSDAEERVAESVLTDNKHHLLFIGPRGSGKTHFTTLLFHRIDAREELRASMRIAWLNEDDTCPRVLDLLLRIHEALSKKYPSEHAIDFIEALGGQSEARATSYLADLLLMRLGERRLVVLVENLDEHFKAIGESGQMTLRALIQNHPVFCLVSTAQSLFEGVQERTSPFFGFFQLEHLKPLTVEEAATLLGKIARLNGNEELAVFLETRTGLARVRALHHLSGGNQRIYIVLSELITRDSIEGLVGPFEEMIDELTPYYQERIRSLAPLQRRIIEHLCRQSQPTAVKAISSYLVTSHQTIASQLQVLRERGYLESQSRGRESLYELSEPLMRLCVEVKDNQQREPLRLVMDFLRIWYDRSQLEQQLSSLPPGAPERSYVARALELARSEPLHLRLRYLVDAATRLEPSSSDGFIARIDALSELFRSAQEANEAGDPQQSLSVIDHALEREIVPPMFLPTWRVSRALNLIALSRPDDAVAELNTAIADRAATAETVVIALLVRGAIHVKHGRFPAAIVDLTTLLRLHVPIDHASTTTYSRTIVSALFLRSAAHFNSASWNEGYEDLDQALAGANEQRSPDLTDVPSLATAILHAGFGQSAWLGRIEPLAEIYARHGLLPGLGAGLVRSLRGLRDIELDGHALDQWRNAWLEAGEGHEELRVPLRLFSAGIAYLKTGDRAATLDLFKDERRIVHEALGLESPE